MKFLRWVALWMDRLCVLIGAFIGSQTPAFIQQYTQRLAGHMEELNHLLSQINALAHHSNKSINEYIQKFLVSQDADFIRQGELMLTLQARWQTLEHAFQELTHSTIWTRPYVFAKEFQYDLAQATLASFQPSITLNLEGICYTLAGMIFILAIYKTILKSIEKIAHKIKSLRGDATAIT